jgi:hypothetical protein
MPSRRPDPETGLIPVDPPQEATFDMVAEELPVPYRTPRPRRRVESWMPQTRLFAGAQMDFARQMVAIYFSQTDAQGNTRVPRIEWVTIPAGEINPEAPFYLDERAADMLAESLEPCTGRRNERREMDRRYEEARMELRSVANQLDEVRNHRDTLAEQATFLRRQVAWLERELRDANRERRGVAPAPEPTPSAFSG